MTIRTNRSRLSAFVDLGLLVLLLALLWVGDRAIVEGSIWQSAVVTILVVVLFVELLVFRFDVFKTGATHRNAAGLLRRRLLRRSQLNKTNGG